MADTDYIDETGESIAEEFETEDVNFIEVDAEEITNRLIERFEYYTGDILYAGDERRIFLQGLALVLADEANNINETGRGNLLRYATGDEVDAIGELFGNTRLEAEKATTTLKFTIYQSMNESITIPAGTRATPDGTHLFATDEDIVFEALTPDLSMEVSATAVEAGTIYNGFIVGQINRLVDYNPYIYTVTNTEQSIGGTDIEDDDSYKERLRIAPFRYAVAGPAESYRAIALSVSSKIGDVTVYSPSAGVVEIVVVLDGGVVPDNDDPVLAQIENACSDKTVRPLTDKVQVTPATASDMAINFKYYVFDGTASITQAVAEAVEEYKTWQTAKIGRAINPDYLTKLVMDAGAARVEITSPTFTQLENYEIANITSTNFTYGGSIVL